MVVTPLDSLSSSETLLKKLSAELDSTDLEEDMHQTNTVSQIGYNITQSQTAQHWFC